MVRARGLSYSSDSNDLVTSHAPRQGGVFRRRSAHYPRAALKACVLFKELFGGEIRLVPDDQGGLVAHWNLHTAALLRGVGTVGSGGVL